MTPDTSLQIDQKKIPFLKRSETARLRCKKKSNYHKSVIRCGMAQHCSSRRRIDMESLIISINIIVKRLENAVVAKIFILYCLIVIFLIWYHELLSIHDIRILIKYI